MSVLGHDALVEALNAPKLEDRLVVTPILNRAMQINEASIDIRLGNAFIVTKRGNLPVLDPADPSDDERRYQTKHFVNYRRSFVLHPNELVLASTLEYFRLPVTVAATVTSRSSWGRAGLVIATATAVHPGFCGSITLELLNLGAVPLVLYPGISVAQIIFFFADRARPYSGTLAQQTGAHFGGVARDKKMTDRDFWLPRREPTTERVEKAV